MYIQSYIAKNWLTWLWGWARIISLIKVCYGQYSDLQNTFTTLLMLDCITGVYSLATLILQKTITNVQWLYLKMNITWLNTCSLPLASSANQLHLQCQLHPFSYWGQKHEIKLSSSHTPCRRLNIGILTMFMS